MDWGGVISQSQFTLGWFDSRDRPTLPSFWQHQLHLPNFFYNSWLHFFVGNQLPTKNEETLHQIYLLAMKIEVLILSFRSSMIDWLTCSSNSSNSSSSNNNSNCNSVREKLKYRLSSTGEIIFHLLNFFSWAIKKLKMRGRWLLDFGILIRSKMNLSGQTNVKI